MDGFPALTNISSATTTVILMGYMIYKVLKHSRCRSLCCGNKTEIRIDLEPDTKAQPLQSDKV
jgi:hypothetical protein